MRRLKIFPLKHSQDLADPSVAFSQARSLGEMVKAWDSCVHKVLTEYARQFGEGSFSSTYGVWESCVSAWWLYGINLNTDNFLVQSPQGSKMSRPTTLLQNSKFSWIWILTQNLNTPLMNFQYKGIPSSCCSYWQVYENTVVIFIIYATQVPE